MALTRMILLAGASAVTLAACTSPEVATDDPRQRTKEGAITGALVGGVLGALTGDDRGERQRGALAGAVIGAGVGAAVGYNLDQQAAELQRDFSNGRIQIINNGDHLVVRMPEGILFDVDSSAIYPSVESDLRVLADSLQRYPDSTVEIVGHTDNTGSYDYNLALSQRRANAVANVLVASGVPGTRIVTRGASYSQPVASNDTPEGRARNRRVDIIIRPNKR